MRILCFLALGLAGCGPPADRLSEEQANAEQNWVVEPAVAVEPRPPAAAPSPPATKSYKAVGTEPGWALTIDATTARYQGEYGSVNITEPTPANFRPAPGSYAGARLNLTITPGPCSDGMSDFVYRHTVKLVADGKAVAGCGGGTMPPIGLADTSWSVTAINGRATPGGASYFLVFTGVELSAKFGCNAIRGSWRLNGDHLSAGPLTQTEMACPEPAMSFERLGGAILGSNMRVERPSGEKMRLVSEAGSIDLKRAI